jgi:HPt (histidine-containing phosphotransfer) domain-containing protein
MSTPTIDRNTVEALIETTDAEFVNELIEAYLDDSPGLIDELQAAIEQNDPILFRRAAHTLKSSSASLGVTGLSELSNELERIGKSGNLEQLDSKMDHLKSEFSQVEREFMAITNE